jgi:hypothetical protein
LRTNQPYFQLNPSLRFAGFAASWLVGPLAAAAGTVSQPGDLTAGTTGPITITYTADAVLDPGDLIHIDDPMAHGQRISSFVGLDASVVTCGAGRALVSATASVGSTAVLGVRRINDFGAPEDPGATQVWIDSGRLQAGESIRVQFGAVGCQFEAPIRAYEAVPWPVLERVATPDAEVVDTLLFNVTAGDVADVIVHARPSRAALGDDVSVTVTLVDVEGNPTTGDVEVEVEGQTWLFGADADPTHTFVVPASTLGVMRTEAVVTGALSGRWSVNPVEVRSLPPEGVYWLDFDGRRGHSPDADPTADTIHGFARDVAGLDGGAEIMVGHGVTAPSPYDSEAVWEELRDRCRDQAEASYAPLLGWEWSGSDYVGDRHLVLYDGCDSDAGDADIHDLTDLTEFLDAQPDEATVIAFDTLEASAWRELDPPVRSAIAAWSGREGDATRGLFGSVPDAWGNELYLGVVAFGGNEDGFLGNPLWEGPAGSGGLTAVRAPDPSASSLLQAVRDRHTWATTGPRILLDLDVRSGAVAAGTLGDRIIVRLPTVTWSAVGTADLTSVRLRSLIPGDPIIDEVDEAPLALEASGTHSLAWSGEPVLVWLEVEQADGHQAWSSPVWLSNDCPAVGPDLTDPAGLCDQDGDGVFAVDYEGNDCDDDDPAIYPGAVDVPYDGRDGDCSGGSDYDADGDGEERMPRGDDCDDADPDVYPGAVDAWYDGVDSDCGGEDDYDADDDGDRAEDFGGGDCDDGNRAVSSLKTEIPFDGIDQDCDGLFDDADGDRDGFVGVDAGGDDCDDSNGSVYPGAVDPLYDGVDSNCDGSSDWDADGDGYDHPDGGGDDCDDGDRDVHPGAADDPYDGVDTDCAGPDTYDADGDGFAAAPWGPDCADWDPAVHPDAADAPYDGVDADCAGGSDNDADGDGQDAVALGGQDCDDQDAAVFVGAEDDPYDGVDTDCSGPDTFDVDGDGWIASIDCNDLDPDLHPGSAGWPDRCAPPATQPATGCAHSPTPRLWAVGLLALLASRRRRAR